MLSGSGLPRVRVGRASAPSPPAATERPMPITPRSAAAPNGPILAAPFSTPRCAAPGNWGSLTLGAGTRAKRELRNGLSPLQPSNRLGREYRAAIKGKARPCRRGFPDGLRQRHDAAPELVLAAHVHIVLAHEVKLAIGTV